MGDETFIMKKANRTQSRIIMESRAGWDMFSADVAWFIYDFFKYDLNGYEKLMFYCYYIKGMTLKEIAESANCTFQNIGVVIKKIEQRLQWAWKNQEEWRKRHDS